jgi:hypothetical protein
VGASCSSLAIHPDPLRHQLVTRKQPLIEGAEGPLKVRGRGNRESSTSKNGNLTRLPNVSHFLHLLLENSVSPKGEESMTAFRRALGKIWLHTQHLSGLKRSGGLDSAEVGAFGKVVQPEDALSQVQKECILLGDSPVNLNTYCVCFGFSEACQWKSPTRLRWITIPLEGKQNSSGLCAQTDRAAFTDRTGRHRFASPRRIHR